VYGAAEVRFVDRKLQVDESRIVSLAAPITEGAVPVDWDTADEIELAPDALQQEAPHGARFQPVPPAAARGKNYAAWSRDLAAWLAANESVELLRSAASGAVSHLGETENDFRGRLQQAARESRDSAVEALRRKYAPKEAALDEKLRRARQALGREQEQASGHQVQTAISVGATLLGALLGRKSIGGTIGRATTAARGVGRSMKESQDVGRAQESIRAIEDQQRRLGEELQADIAALETAAASAETLERIVVRPKAAHIAVKLVALVWRPPLP
jgi:hypothetical protein